MSDINWAGLNQQRNPFANFAEGLERGTDMRRQQERDNMFAQRQEFEMGQAQRRQALEDQQLARRTAAGAAVAKGDFAGARTAAEGDFDLLEGIGKLDEAQRKAARDNAEDLGGFAAALKNVPYEQRRGIIAQAKDTLVGYGMRPEQIDAFDPNDQNLDAQLASAMDLKTALEEANRLRDDKRAGEQAAEVRRHNRVTEGLSADNNRRGWASFNERKKAGGFGTPGVGGGVVADDDVEIDP